MKRRNFIKKSSALGALISLGSIPSLITAKTSITKLTILHTNDFEGNIANYKSLASSIENIRSNNENVLLFDSGDFIGANNQNLGEFEAGLMNNLKYDAITLGNKEFVYGTDKLSSNLKLASAPVVASNYSFSDKLKEQIGDYQIIYKGGLKIGVFGLGINLSEFYSPEKIKNINYQNPIETANNIASILRQKKHCDLVVCLSHLGYKYKSDKTDDFTLVKNTKNIDLVLGGHSHNNLKKGIPLNNKLGIKTLVNQAGSFGCLLGKIDLVFEHQKVKSINCRNIEIKGVPRFIPSETLRIKKL